MSVNKKINGELVSMSGGIGNIATTQQLGAVKPDGVTILVDQNGVISASGGGGGSVAEIWEEKTLLANNWSNSQYSLESIYPSTTYDIVNVLPTTNTTEAQKTAWAAAECGGYNSTNVIIANGTVPTIDITLGFCVRVKEVEV